MIYSTLKWQVMVACFSFSVLLPAFADSDTNSTNGSIEGPCDLSYATVNVSDFDDGVFLKKNCSPIIFNHSLLAGSMRGPQFDHGDFDYITVPPNVKLHFSEGSFKHAHFKHAVFRGLGINFSVNDMEAVDFSDAAFQAKHTQFSQSNMRYARFASARFGYDTGLPCSVTGDGCPQHTEFERTILQHADFKDSYLAKVRFIHSDLASSDFSGARIGDRFIFEHRPVRDGLLLNFGALSGANCPSDASRDCHISAKGVMTAIFDNNRLTGANFAHTHLYSAAFLGDNQLDKADFTGTETSILIFGQNVPRAQVEHVLHSVSYYTYACVVKHAYALFSSTYTQTLCTSYYNSDFGVQLLLGQFHDDELVDKQDAPLETPAEDDSLD